MPATFPTSLPGLKTNYVDNVDDILADNQNQPNLEVNALAAKVGVDASGVTTSHDYKLSSVTGSAKAISNSYLDTDGTLTANSDTKIATQKAVKTYVDANGGGIKYAADAEASDSYAITVSPAPTSYDVGDTYLFRANTANTGAATLNVNELGAITIKKKADDDLSNNDILANQMVLVAYNEFETEGETVDSYSESNYDDYNNFYDGHSKEQAAQSFSCSTTAVLTSCKFYIRKAGSPTGNITAKLYAHTGTYGTSSVPTGTALDTSANFDVSSLTTSFALVTFTFTGAYEMQASTYYTIVLDCSSVGSAGNEVYYGQDASAPSHGGNYSYHDGANWNAVSGVDSIFYVYGTITTTRFEMLSQIAN